MAKYICKKNFLDGKDQTGQIIQCAKGSVYVGENAERHLAAGFLVSEADLSVAELEELEKKIKSLRAEVSGLEAKSKTLKQKLQASGQDPDEQEPNGDEDGEGEHEEDGEFEEGDDGEFDENDPHAGDEGSEDPAAEVSAQKKKKKKKKKR